MKTQRTTWFTVAVMLAIGLNANAGVYDGTNPPALPGTVGDYYSYTLGVYLSGGTASGYNPSPPLDNYLMPSPKGVAGATNELDFHWIQGNPIYDLGFSSNLVFVFPTGDHPPYPQDNVEAQVYGCANLGDPWIAASLNNVYRDGWVDYNNDGDSSIEADDWASEWIFPNQEAYRYIKLVQGDYGPDGDMETDAIGAPEPVLAVNVDIKPTSCPNPLAARSKGVLPVAILGTEDFDVTTIDVCTITLAGVSPIRSNYQDVATPLDKEDECECNSEGPDGYMDLTLKFDRQEIIATLGDLSLLPKRSVIPLTLSGMLMEEDAITLEGTDCIVFLNLRQGR